MELCSFLYPELEELRSGRIVTDNERKVTERRAMKAYDTISRISSRTGE